eukprot:CAMPEP_0184869978 /NCGR_PEP_ID=MMETSP0580-20130426/36050_1 /TAXON_ID=1118495 /ORGANISM="Dactyliosolen fragilissimus" /LENGTH=535 /DNA_ID=CAMNT_0027371831 /DNA_START=67 /DNA_END=1674 /DNA_ORIENTATION=+
MPNNKPSRHSFPSRRSKRGNYPALFDLASRIVKNNALSERNDHDSKEASNLKDHGWNKTSKNGTNSRFSSDNSKYILVVTGAGLSVPSGIQPFRGKNGIWSQTLWSNATREAFRADPLDWYNSFWLKHFPPELYPSAGRFKPNDAHEALAKIANAFDQVRLITQNVDGLHTATECKWNWDDRLIEAHGRLGLYKCIPDEDSDTSEDETDDEANNNSYDHDHDDRTRIKSDRKIRLGSRRKRQHWKERYREKMKRRNDGILAKGPCIHEMETSIHPSQILPFDTRNILTGYDDGNTDCQNQKNLQQLYDTHEKIVTDSDSTPINEELLTIASTPSPINANSINECVYDLKSNRRENEVDNVQITTPISSVRTSSSIISKDSSSDFEKQAISTNTNKKRRRSKSKLSSNKMHKTDTNAINKAPTQLQSPPLCPLCSKPCPPQALLFDEGYHSHEHYQFQKMEEWISNSSVFIFVGTSFSVNITEIILECARDYNVPVYNFNIEGGTLDSTTRLDVQNIIGDVEVTLPMLWDLCNSQI